MSNDARLLMRALQACARRDAPDAIRAFRSLVQRHPLRCDYRLALAELLHHQELYGPAIVAYRRVLGHLRSGRAICPPGPPGDPPITEARVRFALGGALAGAGRTAEAEASLRRAVALDPCARHRIGLGAHLELHGGRAEALTLYERALADEAECAEAHYRVASWHVWTDPERAEAGFRRTVALDDTHATAWAALGLLRGQRASWKEADECLARAIRLDPGSALPHVYRGHHAWRRRRFRKAEAAYRRGMRADPGDPHPHFALGDLFRHEGRRADARRAYEDALSLDPRCGDAALRLAWLHDEDGRPEEAARLFRRGLALAPQHPWEDEVRERLAALGAPPPDADD